MTNYLEEENARLRRELQDIRDQQRTELEEARRERKQQWAHDQCHAENWVDAFQKGLDRYRQEANEEESLNEKMSENEDQYFQTNIDTFFTGMLPKIERAQAIYAQQINPIEAKIRQMRNDARYAIADAIEREYPDDNAMKELAEALRDDNWDWLVDW